MGLFSARVQFEFVPLFLCQFLTFTLLLLAVVYRCFPDLLGLVFDLSLVRPVVYGRVLDPLFVLLRLRILLHRYRCCHCLSRIVFVPPDPIDHYRYSFCRCLRVSLVYLPIPKAL